MEKNIILGLAGNPNCGKTTLFNQLTGLNQKTANWPGVTVERIEGRTIFQGKVLHLIDLPGTYSLMTYTLEEQVTRESLLDGTVDMIVNVIDASALERSLYLTFQLLQLDRPMVIALNMMDVLKRRGQSVDAEQLSKSLGGVPVIPISARKKEGLDQLLEQVQRSSGTKGHTFSGKCSDNDIYQQIGKIMSECITEPAVADSVTDRMDRILIHPVMGVPIFLVFMAGVFLFTFLAGDQIKVYFELLLEAASDIARTGLTGAGVSAWLVSLIVDGIMQGVGGVLTFLPNIFFLFVALGVLENCGYMARAAYVMNEAMAFAGLSGKAFLPMMLGFGCTVPAVMATRTLTTDSERKKTIFILPFMSCSARIPIYVLFSSMFFPGTAVFAAFSMYLIGLGAAFLAAGVYRWVMKPDDKPVLFIELPEYRTPDLKAIGIYVWDKVKEYITKAGTVIFLASVVLWFLLNYHLGGPADAIGRSFGAGISRIFVPLFKPVGLGYWQLIAALISGLSAKEVVVSSLYILYEVGGEAGAASAALSQILIADGFTKVNGYAFMVFCLLYSPCMAAISTIRKELNSVRWTLVMVSFQMILAWLGAFIVYQIGRLLC